MTPYYQQDGITIYHGDCRELGAVGDVVITDPPYGVGFAYDVHRDTLAEWLAVMQWLVTVPRPLAFTISHSRLLDLPARPQWIGCWDKEHTGGYVNGGAEPCWEPICFYRLPDATGRPRWKDVFRVQAGGFQHNNLDKHLTGHPCPKPVALYKQLIRVMPEGVIYDPMMGSGTTLRAAKDMGRPAIGCDVSERYCEIAATRLRQRVLPLECSA